MWRRDADQFVSAMRLLADSEKKYPYTTYLSGRTRGLAICTHGSIATLALETKELAIDATLGTNNAGMDLFVVLAELDGIGVLLAYLFVETFVSDGGVKTIAPGAMTRVLDQFLRPFKISGFDPTFFGCDKDGAEIAATQQAWPATLFNCVSGMRSEQSDKFERV